MLLSLLLVALDDERMVSPSPPLLLLIANKMEGVNHGSREEADVVVRALLLRSVVAWNGPASWKE